MSLISKKNKQTADMTFAHNFQSTSNKLNHFLEWLIEPHTTWNKTFNFTQYELWPPIFSDRFFSCFSNQLFQFKHTAHTVHYLTIPDFHQIISSFDSEVGIYTIIMTSLIPTRILIIDDVAWWTNNDNKKTILFDNTSRNNCLGDWNGWNGFIERSLRSSIDMLISAVCAREKCEEYLYTSVPAVYK